MFIPSDTFPWRVLLLKLGALFSFCGGPMVLADSLKVHMDKDAAFAIAFAPIVGLIFGIWSLWEEVPDRWDVAMVTFGAVCAVVMVGMQVFGIVELAAAPEKADAGLNKLGIAVGMVFAVFYAYAASRFFRSRQQPA